MAGMLPLRIATRALRHGARPEYLQQAALAPSSRLGYATQAGQPMPPPPPGSSGKPKNGKKKVVSSTSQKAPGAASTDDPMTPVSDTTSPPTSSPVNDYAADPVPLADEGATTAPSAPMSQIPETPLPPASTSKEIKPVTSLASQYLDRTEIPESASERAERTGARSTLGKRGLSSSEKKRRNMGRLALALMAVGAGAGTWHLGREWDSEREKERLGRKVTNEEGLDGRWQRTQARFTDMLDYFNKPAFDPFLPDLLPPPHQKPYTLILSLDDLLIHSTWTREHGWRTAKRPGVDYFLAYLAQFYEIVLFTSQPSYTAQPICEKLDPYMVYMPYRLFRDCTRYEDKDLIKDLSYLGRDLSKVIIMDTDAKKFKLHQDNGIAMRPWDGARSDRGLVGMIPFLEAIAMYNVKDVRPILSNYRGKDIPNAWAEYEQEEKRKLVREWEEKGGNRSLNTGFSFSSMLGMGNSSTQTRGGPPKTFLETQRELYQKAYLEEQKYWADNKANIEKLMEEDREKQKRESTSSVLNFMSSFVPIAPPPGSVAPSGSAEQAPATASQK